MMSVVFWEYHDGRLHPTPITDVAQHLGVDVSDLHNLFRGWKAAEWPETYRLKLSEKRYLEVFRTEGDALGWVRLVRPGGRYRRTLSTRSWLFTLEVAV